METSTTTAQMRMGSVKRIENPFSVGDQPGNLHAVLSFIMTKRNVLIGSRMFFGLLTLVALGSQLVIQIRSGFSLINFFSYFTNLSNLFAAVVMIIAATSSVKFQGSSPLRDSLRGAAAVGMAVVGIVFHLLLRNVDMGGLLPWVNFVIHTIMPVAVVLDWLVDPPRTKLGRRQIGCWLIFPLCFLIYSIVRGAIVGFYAYPFFNPALAGGYGGVALYCIGILVVFLIVSGVLLAPTFFRNDVDP